ncbi:MAG TPA: hypothetical protein VNI78_04880 [Vicinamibacterales bacterium]|nr:hypothetical protein [Vicinamibacterales bacterium]
MEVFHTVVREAPDSTIAELCRAYNRQVPRDQRTTPTSFGLALHRAGFVPKKRPRPSECDRPDVAVKRAAFLRWMRRVDPRRLILVDASGAHVAMARSHVWVKRGEEYVEPRPMNWRNT